MKKLSTEVARVRIGESFCPQCNRVVIYYFCALNGALGKNMASQEYQGRWIFVYHQHAYEAISEGAMFQTPCPLDVANPCTGVEMETILSHFGWSL